MKDVNILLDKCKEMRSLASDRALSKWLGKAPSAVANYRKGRSLPEMPVAMKLCDGAEERYQDWIPQIEAHRAERSGRQDLKRSWLQLGASIAASFATILLTRMSIM